MNVLVSNTLTIENPTQEALMWCKKNLTIANPEYAKKVRMHFWVGDTPSKLSLYEQEGNNLILPFGTLRTLPDCIAKESTFTSSFPAPVSVVYGGVDVPLYDYQKDAVEAVCKAQYGILQSPAGSGKTQMGIALVKKYGKRALWLTHTLDLLRQSKERAERYVDKSLIGTVTEGKVNIGKGITFATIQTMCKLDLTRYKDMWDTIIVDECFKGDTEMLTEKGFKRFDALNGDEKIAQYNENGTIEFVTPISHIKRYHKGPLVKFTVKDGRDVYMTSNHIQPLFYPRTGEIKRETIGNVRFNAHKKLILSGQGVGNNKFLSPLERLAIASQADGTIQRVCKDHVSWTIQLTKDRKINRFLELMSELELEWSEIKSAREGARRFAYCTPKTITKSLTTTFDLNMGKDRAIDFIKEVCKWDGSEKSRYDYYYCSTIKENAEFVSAVAVLGGYQSSLTVEHDTRSETYSDVYRVYGNYQQHKDVQCCKKKYVPYEGDVYCVEVPSHMIVVRADGFAFVSGNCHRVAGTPTAMTRFSKVLNSLSARHKYGLSATVHRSDGMIEATYALLGHVVYTVPDEAVGDKIMKVGILPVGTGVEIDRSCLNTDGTLNYTKLISYLCNCKIRNDAIRACIVSEFRHSCLILSDRLEHLEFLMNTLPDFMREKAVMVSGKMTSKKGKADREKAIEDMRSDKKKYLFATYALAKEGLDIPCLERLFLITPQKDYAVITQSIGRIARVCEGKAEPIAYDFVDNIAYLVKSYKKRCTTYRKNGCYFVEEVKN